MRRIVKIIAVLLLMISGCVSTKIIIGDAKQDAEHNVGVEHKKNIEFKGHQIKEDDKNKQNQDKQH